MHFARRVRFRVGVGLRVQPDKCLKVHFRSNAQCTEIGFGSATVGRTLPTQTIFLVHCGIFGKAKLVLAVGWPVGPRTVVGSSVTPSAPKKSLSRHRTGQVGLGRCRLKPESGALGFWAMLLKRKMLYSPTYRQNWFRLDIATCS